MAKVVPLRDRSSKSSTSVLRKVPPGRPPNRHVRTREYLREDEVKALMKAAGAVGRHRHRDKTLILVTYRHGLRVSEAVDLEWNQVDFESASIHINRLKNGKDATHPLQGDVLRSLRRLQRESSSEAFLFTTERGGPLTRSTVNKMISRAGKRAGISYPVHPHMLRHGTGYYLANKGVETRVIQDYLGHKNIAHSVLYTELSETKFKGLWK